MKPRIRLFGGIWSCATVIPWRAGYGKTWREAWDDFVTQPVRTGRFG